MSLMLCHPDSPYIRCVGFLYLRYAVEPSSLWKWFEPYLYDEESVQVTPSLSKALGQYVRDLLTDMNYVGTLLPRLPIAVERDLKCKLLLAEKVEQRAREHMRPRPGVGPPTVEFFEEGIRVRAMYGDDENPVTWYDAVIDRVIRRDEETGEALLRPKFVVTFPEYGNTELVTLGELDLPGTYRGAARVLEADPSRGDFYGGGGWKNQDLPTRDDLKTSSSGKASFHKAATPHDLRICSGDDGLMEEVLRRERDKIAAKGRQYSRRPPPTLKSSISTKQDRDPRKRIHKVEHSEEKIKDSHHIGSEVNASFIPLQKEKSSVEIAAIAEKKRRLLEKYG
jgi:pre-mRNA-splicing factor 38B